MFELVSPFVYRKRLYMLAENNYIQWKKVAETPNLASYIKFLDLNDGGRSEDIKNMIISCTTYLKNLEKIELLVTKEALEITKNLEIDTQLRELLIIQPKSGTAVTYK